MVITEREYVLDNLRKFLDGNSNEWDWDEFISTPLNVSYYDSIRILCRDLPNVFPADKASGFYCSEEGWCALKCIYKNLIPR